MHRTLDPTTTTTMLPSTVSSRRCNVCIIDKIRSKSDLHLCSGCRIISYCGREHQLLDWKIHKSFCLAIKHILKTRNISHIMDLEGPVTNWAQFEKALILAKCLLHTILKRDLCNHEVELLTFPVHCQICFTRPDNKTFFDCSNCKAVSYCSRDHQKDDDESHSKWCQYLKYYYIFLEDEVEMDLDFSEAPIVDSTDSMPDELFSLIETLGRTPQGVQITRYPKTIEDYRTYLAVSNFSCVATLLHAIRLCQKNENCNDILTIYLVGTRDEDLYLLESHCAFLSSQLPSVKKFNFYLIGPELIKMSKSLGYSVYTHERETEINLYFVKDYFENFVNQVIENIELEKMPHLIAAFNCGFYEYVGTPKNTWTRGIKAFFEFDRIPIVFTSYTKLESCFDLREFTECANELEMQYQIVVEGEENPFKDYRPLRNMELHDRNDLVYFRNGYLHIVIVNSKG